jgi:uncharacterized repeat protein (TIGR02543 family)
VLDLTGNISYWSSSPATNTLPGATNIKDVNDKAQWTYWDPTKTPEKTQADWRSRARSVRCVKNEVNTWATAIEIEDIHLNGWTNALITIDTWEVKSLKNPARSSSTFNGWYATPDYSWSPVVTWSEVEAWSSLYAKFTCNTAWYIWNGSACVKGYVLSFDTDGGSLIAPQEIQEWNTWHRPDDPTKESYGFDGWYTAGGEPFDFDEVLTANTTAYAHWRGGTYTVTIVADANSWSVTSW